MPLLAGVVLLLAGSQVFRGKMGAVDAVNDFLQSQG
jgi:hypothetical protein